MLQAITVGWPGNEAIQDPIPPEEMGLAPGLALLASFPGPRPASRRLQLSDGKLGDGLGTRLLPFHEEKQLVNQVTDFLS